MNFFLGCDVAKSKLDVSLVNEQGVEQWIDKIPNEAGALTSFLLTVAGHYVDDKITCVVEATGTFHNALLETTMALGIPCLVYNPLLTKQGIKSSVRGKKTDRTDALLIARMGLRGEGRLHKPEPYMTTKYYVRSQQRLGDYGVALKLHREHTKSVLGDEMSRAAQELLENIQTQIKLARAQFVKDTIATAPTGLVRRLQTIPGVGPYVACSIIGEIQTIERFSSAKALTAYAGLDPVIRQSGHSLNYTGRLTKRGLTYLRRSIFIAASVARQHDPYFRAIYERRRAEGKSYTAAVCIVARKLLSIVRAVWLYEQDYDSSLLVIKQ